MSCHIEIAFMGDYRPRHWESDSLKECCLMALRDVKDKYLAEVIQDAVIRVLKSPTVSACSLQGYTPTPYAVTVARYPHDPWLEGITKDYPHHPRVKYPKEVTA